LVSGVGLKRLEQSSMTLEPQGVKQVVPTKEK